MEIVGYTLFPKEVESVAKMIERLQSGEIVEELKRLVSELKGKGYDKFVFERESLAKSAHKELDVEVEMERPSPQGNYLRQNMAKIAIEIGHSSNPEEFRSLLRQVSLHLTKLQVQRTIERSDLLLIQAVGALDDVDKMVNLLSSRLREWYGLHFPELNRIMDKHETYLRLIVDLGDRSNFTPDRLQEESLPQERGVEVFQAAQRSIGAAIEPSDLSTIQSLSKTVLELYKDRRLLEEYIDAVMAAIAPNMRALVGPTIGGRLIAVAGGLRNLAAKPASTIQVLGAEKAMFRSLRTGTRPPKHGIIFQLPEVHGSVRWQRGKVARAVAGKLAIVARVDAYGGGYVGDTIKANLDRRVEEIRKKYEQPPSKELRARRSRKGR